MSGGVARRGSCSLIVTVLAILSIELNHIDYLNSNQLRVLICMVCPLFKKPVNLICNAQC